MENMETGTVIKPTRNGRLFMHGVWASVELVEYIRSKGPRAASDWMRHAMTIVMEAEIRKGLGIRPVVQVPDAGLDAAPDAEEVQHEQA